MQLLPGDGTYRALQDGAVTINIADYPSLQQDGGVVEGKAAGYPYPIIVVRLAGAYSALSGVCPHQGCTVIPTASAAPATARSSLCRAAS